ncbi:DUF5050 domain-containing protein [Clostridium aestuarii]|uniref:DUF5050 domain-containing protein n=1 Tax=Clostridium aestuarii TaxID=338193 RepID=A0ABT4CVD0_9CLOT|nr:DUF5050 domain-containing protein [Clostridium aestuarii]MCY6482940.1 DUF5050 domain-containing protein [Clostridium aestuarii]
MKNKGIKVSLIIVLVITISVSAIYSLLNQQHKNINSNKQSSNGTENKIEDNLSSLLKNTDKRSENLVKYDKYQIDKDIKEYANPNNIELYKVLYDSIDELKDEVDVSNFTIDDNELKNLTKAIWYRVNYELFYIKNFQLSNDKKKFKITYTYDKSKIKEMKKNFNEKIDYILNEIIKPDFSELEKELAIYRYITKNVSYNYDNNGGSIDEVNAYSAIVKGKAICLGYTNAMKYLLNKAGIECHTVDSDEIAHIWNMVKIEGVYYQLDATWEADSNKGTQLRYFNFTDEDRRQNSPYKVWFGGNRNYKRITMPTCNNDKFKFVRDMNYYCVTDGWFYYGNLKDNNKIYKVKTDGTNNQKICDDSIKNIEIKEEWIYYSNLSDEGRLYKIKKDGMARQVVDDEVSIN